MSFFGIGDIGSALIGAASQESTNQMNYQIAKEANELKEKLFNEGNEFTNQQREAQNQFSIEQLNREQDYNSNMWYKNAQWNSEQAQVQRLLEAGLNPALTFGSSAATAAGSSPSGAVPSAGSSVGVPNIEAAKMANPLASGVDIAGALNSAISTGIDNSTRLVKNLAEIDDLKASAENKREQSNYTKLQSAAYEQAFGNIVAQYKADNELTMAKAAEANSHNIALGAQAELMKTEKSLNDKQLQYFDADKLAYYANMAAQLRLTGSQIGLNQSMAKNYLSSAMLADANRAGVELNNNIIRKTSNYIINKTYYESKSAQNTYTGGQRYNDTWLGDNWIKLWNTILTPIGANLNFGISSKIGK